jgi:3-hydroxyisobutyrate dehydrogenase-like beta-hydroxyacid dehydrogenase
VSLSWAIIGFGEAAQVLVAADLLGPARPTVVLPGPRPISAATKARLHLAGIKPVRESAAIRMADVVISVVTPAAALEVARFAAPLLTPNAIYIDANSISGPTARSIANLIAERTARFVDAVFIGALPLLRSSVPLYLSGTEAPAFAGLVEQFGLQPIVLSDRAGDASELKMLWGVMSKGTIGLVAEMLTAAEGLDLTGPLIQLLAQEFGRTGSPEMLLRMLESTARTGPRRLEEMAAVRETLTSARVPSFMVDGAAAWITLLSRAGSAGGARDLRTAIKAAAADVNAQAAAERAVD